MYLTVIIMSANLSASALEPGIDLIEALNLHSNYSRYIGVSLTQGGERKMGYRLASEDKMKRNLVLPSAVFHQAANAIKRSPDFTFAATIRQEESNSGAIISFADGVNRYLELQSSGRKDEIRFHYTSKSSNGAILYHTETFSYRLADYEWHKVALSVSGTEIQLLIDCKPLYRRVTHYMPDRNFSASNNTQLFLGQRNNRGHSPFKGDIEAAYIAYGPYGYLNQCPLSDTQCPTCGQFSLLEDTIVELRQTVIELTKRLVAAENRVSRLEDCDCKKSCKLDGVIKNDGEEWSIECKTCKCEQGIVTCGPKNCGKPKCKYPQPQIGECCPKCLKKCLLNGKEYEHGETSRVNCNNCTCTDGSMSCPKYLCPELRCPVEQRRIDPEGCCQYCPGDDYCSKGHACHTNATCLNLNTKYLCTCRLGFQGDGLNCSDIDECAQQGNLNGNHCHLNTKCVNTPGSYVCACLPGYRRVDKFNCAEIDECQTGQHSCHENAKCINTQGSYHCRCKPGYKGDGYVCKPACNQTCLNGGRCLSPGQCTCRMGYVGASCEQDLDECATGLHTCKNSAVCINMPGWYYCKCKLGYETRGNDCYDINECYHNTHSCHSSAKCVNTDGHFRCECNENDPNCRLSCMFEDSEVSDGGRVYPRNQPCKICTCNKGVISCEEKPCNCSTWRGGSDRDICCPQCDPKESCQHQELKHVVFKSGEQWIYQCQTCECLYGEFDCWKLECPPLTCDNPLPLSPGDCCPRCEDDPCNYLGNSTDSSGKPCTYKNHKYASGKIFKDLSSDCTTCACKDGKLCCSFDNNCNDDKPRRPKRTSAIGYFNSSNTYTTSKTASTTALQLRPKPKRSAAARRRNMGG